MPRKPTRGVPARTMLSIRLTPAELEKINYASRYSVRAEWVRRRLDLESLPDPLTTGEVADYTTTERG